MTPILISRFLFDLDDLRSHDQDVTYPSSLIRTHPVEKSLTLQFVDPESSVSVMCLAPQRASSNTLQDSDYIQSQIVFSGHYSEGRIRDAGDAEEGYKPTATW